jgi:hypothetical protein
MMLVGLAPRVIAICGGLAAERCDGVVLTRSGETSRHHPLLYLPLPNFRTLKTFAFPMLYSTLYLLSLYSNLHFLTLLIWLCRRIICRLRLSLATTICNHPISPHPCLLSADNALHLPLGQAPALFSPYIPS